MDLKQLRYFLAVVRLGSFSAAAEELGRTQQAVSKGVRQLEERLGVRLVDRSLRQPRPTAFGELLLRHADTVDAALHGFERELEVMRAPDVAPLRIGASATASSRVVSAAVLSLLQQRPGLACHVLGGIDVDLLPRLERGDLDIVVALHTQPELRRDLSSEVLGYESYVVVTGRDHPLARAATISARDLAAQAWIEGINLGEVKGALRSALKRNRSRRPSPFWNPPRSSLPAARLRAASWSAFCPCHSSRPISRAAGCGVCACRALNGHDRSLCFAGADQNCVRGCWPASMPCTTPQRVCPRH